MAQSGLRTKTIFFSKDTVRLDTLSIIPGTITVKKKNGEAADSASYRIDYVNALLIAQKKESKLGDTLKISYKVFPYFFSQKYQQKDVNKIQNNQYGQVYAYGYEKNKDADFFKTEGLTKNGSISRGLSFGNNQDVVLNSNLNLQLAGKLSDNVDIMMAATDQNIPIQPEGNTQQIQDFDKVFIQFGIKELPTKGKTTVTAGDFQIAKPAGYFMNFNKKLQGLSFESKLPAPNSQALTVKASAAVSKGKFARNISVESSDGNTFNGAQQERNQGPYKLRGSENEQFIVVLAGTETVYLNGQLLSRGQENDYTINYNTAEIIFTPKNLITKDKRIAVEFQYSDKNYARSLMHAGTEYESKKIKARINMYSEQDNKNKPLQQELSDPQKKLLAGVGDSLQQAVWPSADSIAFNGTEVLYQKKDTLAHSVLYHGIYIYSTDSTKAHFRLNFSYVGTNKGNYNLKQSAANGKVYEWVCPDSSTRQPKGSYEPVLLLVAPKQKQMVSAGADFILSKNSKLSVEGAASKNNINTFSSKDKANDDGVAGKVSWDNKFVLLRSQADSASVKKDSTKNHSFKDQNWNLLTNLNYEFVQKNFSPIERFRSVEFERDWNRGAVAQTNDQHIMGGSVGVAKNQYAISYDYKSFLEGSYYQGMRHGANLNLGANGFLLNADGSYLDSKSIFSNTRFLRHRASLSKHIPVSKSKSQKEKGLTFGIREQQEQNLIKAKKTDSLVAGSARFTELEPFAEFVDSLKNKYTLSYKQRTDYALKNLGVSKLRKATYAENFGGGVELFSNPNSQFRITGNFRRLTILDTSITTQKKENTVVGRTEYNFSVLKGFFSSSTFYEVGSGLEVKKQFMFLEVAPGQGVYVWNDYNNNGIKELNEFEVSPFPNEANYIKVWVPTADYISTFTNQFSEVFSIKPGAKWRDKKGVKKFVSRFANQTAYRTDRKTTNSDLTVAYNPFLSDVADKTLISLNSSLRNTVYFNQTDPVFGLDYTFQNMRSKSLLENDTLTRENLSNETHVRWNANKKWTLQTFYKEGTKINNSRFFTNLNFRIRYFEAEPKMSFQPDPSFRFSLSYKYSEKRNTLVISTNPQAKAVAQNFGSELKYNTLNKGSLTAKANFILVAYNDAESSPLAFEMLEGLKPGKNYTWNMGYSRTLANNIQLTISYDGRQSPGIKTIHTGNAQVRAFF
ncbi:MAG TPA: hypothetical protein VII99_00260 [Bacteroidia bacterium]